MSQVVLNQLLNAVQETLGSQRLPNDLEKRSPGHRTYQTRQSNLRNSRDVGHNHLPQICIKKVSSQSLNTHIALTTIKNSNSVSPLH